jgi:hypothetical protein
MIDLSVIIVSWNTKKLLADCLDSIFNQTKDLDYEVIVVDNGSTDGSVDLIKKLKHQNLQLIENKDNLGFSKANNQGLKMARGQYFLLLNSDTKVVGQALKNLVDFAKQKPLLGVVGPRLLNPNGSKQPSAAPFLTLGRVFIWLVTGDRFLYSSPDNQRQVDWAMGAALLVTRGAIKKAGLLDEKFFMYLEEVEWCYRIKKAGFENWFYPKAKVYHLVRGGSPGGKKRAVCAIYQGLIYFYQKHFGPLPGSMLKLMLRTKALGARVLGFLTGNKYLQETYAQAFKLVR